MGVTIESLGAAETEREIRALSALLRDAVDSGASIGFLSPMAKGEAEAYSQTVVLALREGSRVLLVARAAEGAMVGSAQLDLATRPNARHRGEVMKAMVHTKARRQGIGRSLMLAIGAHARRRGRTTLVLDTRRGDPAERLYADVGWTLAGVIPKYARSADGSPDASAVYYKLLEGEPT